MFCVVLGGVSAVLNLYWTSVHTGGQLLFGSTWTPFAPKIIIISFIVVQDTNRYRGPLCYRGILSADEGNRSYVHDAND